MTVLNAVARLVLPRLSSNVLPFQLVQSKGVSNTDMSSRLTTYPKKLDRLNQKTTNKSSLPSLRTSTSASLVLQIYVSENDGRLYWRLYVRWRCGFYMWAYGTRRYCRIWVGMHGRVGLRRSWKAPRLWLVLLCECYSSVFFGNVIIDATIAFCSSVGLYSCGIRV